MADNEFTDKVENLFAGSSDEDNMWNTAAKFAAQFDELQVLALTRLTYIANICSDKVKARLLSFRDQYIALMNNRGTSEFVLRMGEITSLKRYLQGISGQIRIDK